MPAGDALIAVVAQWVEKAEGDLRTAAHTLKLKQDCPTETVAFHAQQCVEKYIKAALLPQGVEPPRIHDIEKLVRLLPAGVLVEWPIREQRLLTSYAVLPRYPGAYDPIPRSEARRAVAIARKVRKEIRAMLPVAALRKRSN